MSGHSKVAIFWDYENCSPSCNSPGLGYDIVNNVGRMARVFGSVTTFKAYLDISQSPKSLALRSELQSSGVSMIDCPHNGKKDVVDKMILVDMLAFAVDNVAPATVILITGDRDYAYAIATLRLRKYKVVLIVPSSSHVHVCLESQASVVVDWNSVVLRTRIEPTNSFIRQPYQDNDAQLMAELSRAVEELRDDSDTTVCSTSTGSSSRPHKIDAHDLLQPSTFSNGSDSDNSDCPPGGTRPRTFQELLQIPVGINGEASAPESSVPKTPAHSRRGSVSAPRLPRIRSATVSTPDAVKADRGPGMRSTESLSKPNGRRSSPPDMPDITCSSKSLALPVHYDGPPSSIIIASPLKLQANDDGFGPPHASQLDHGLSRTPSLASPLSTSRTLSGGVPVSFKSSSGRVDMPTAPAPPPITREDPTKSKDECSHKGGASAPDQYDIPIPDEAALREALGLDDDDSGDEQFMSCPSVPDDESRSARSIVTTVDTNASQDHANATLRDSACIASASCSSKSPMKQGTFSPSFGTLESACSPSKASSTSPVPALFTEAARPAQPPEQVQTPLARPSADEEETRAKFQPLIHVLVSAQARGTTRPARSIVATELIQSDKTAYRRVGVSRFREYAALAEKAGLIILGGREPQAWVALHPDWLHEEEESQSSPQSLGSSSLSDAEINHSTAGQSVSRGEGTGSAAPMQSSPPYPEPVPTNDSVLNETRRKLPLIPAYFQPLITCLVRMRDSGYHQTLRFLVDQSLGSSVYAQARVSNFDEYMNRATEVGLIQNGGDGAASSFCL